jgi:hypothetical protein
MPLYCLLVYANTYVNAADEAAAIQAWEDAEDFGLEPQEESRPIAVTLLEDDTEVAPREGPPPGVEDILAWCKEHGYTLISNRPCP